MEGDKSCPSGKAARIDLTELANVCLLPQAGQAGQATSSEIPTGRSPTHVQQLEIPISRHMRGPHIQFDNSHVDGIVGRDNDWAQAASLGKDQMVTFLAPEGESVFLEDTAEPSPGDWCDAPLRLTGRLRWIAAHGLEGQSARSASAPRPGAALSRLAVWPKQSLPVEEPPRACPSRNNLRGNLGSRRADCPKPFPPLAPGWQRRVTGTLRDTTFVASSSHTEDEIQIWEKVPIYTLPG